MRYAILSALSIALAAPVAAEPHEHLWSDPVCEAPSCVGRCCSKKCVKGCTYPGCKMIRVWSETSCSNSGGATGQYSTPLVAPWGPRPGSTGNDACPPHDLGPAACGSWSRISKDCEIQHCTKQCRKCGSNRGDYYNSRPSGCFDE